MEPCVKYTTHSPEPRTAAGRFLNVEFRTPRSLRLVEAEARDAALLEVEEAVTRELADLAKTEADPGFDASPDFYGGLANGQSALESVLAAIASLRGEK